MIDYIFIKCMIYGGYLIIAFLTWLVLSYWLHDTKEELHGNWLASIAIAAFLSIFWPISLCFWWCNPK